MPLTQLQMYLVLRSDNYICTYHGVWRQRMRQGLSKSELQVAGVVRLPENSDSD